MTIHNLVATRKITSGSTTIDSNPCVLKEIIVSDPGQKCVVAIKDDTTIKMLFTLQQNTEQSGPPVDVIKPNMPIGTSLKVEMYKLDPLLFLNFNNNSTTLVEDLSGNNKGIDGTMNNMEAADRGEDPVKGKFINFSGTDEYITFGDNFDLEYNTAHSISFWMHQTSGQSGYIMGKYVSAPGWGVYSNGTNLLFFMRDGASGDLTITNATAIVTNTWTHVTITKSTLATSAGVTFYINGIADTHSITSNDLAATIANALNFALGARSDGGTAWTGKLDEVMIYDRELSAAEVEFIFRNGYGYAACDGARLGDITIVHEK